MDFQIGTNSCGFGGGDKVLNDGLLTMGAKNGNEELILKWVLDKLEGFSKFFGPFLFGF